MKTKLYASLSLLLIIAVYFFTGSTTENTNALNKMQMNPPSPNNGNPFLFGAMHSLADNFAPHINNYEKYDSLGLNLWHSYLRIGYDYPGNEERNTPKGYLVSNDDLFENVTEYADSVLEQMANINSHGNSMLLWARPKIEWLCYGQSSIYEAETISGSNELWFYSFQLSVGESETDGEWNNGNSALHCSESILGPGARFVLQRLKANTEQCRVEYGELSPGWTSDNECDWLIKPRIRIDSAFANNPLNFNTPVCSLTVKNQYGNTFKEVILKVKNFLVDPNDTYNGRYIEEFDFEPNDTTLKIHGNWGDKWGYCARGNHNPDWEEPEDNQADIQVYWYNNCEMWIDYIKVENDVADGLLNENGTSYGMYDEWLQEAVSDGKILIWHIDPKNYELNNLPCLKYIEKRLKEYSNNKFAFVF